MSKQERIKLVFEGIKTFSIVIGATVLFIAVQHPESLLKTESATMERAKLALEILKQNNPSLRAESFRVLRTVWGDDDEWIKQVECRAVIEAGYHASKEAASSKATELQKEILGLGDSATPGYGPRARRLEDELALIKEEQSFYTERIQDCVLFGSGAGGF